MTTYGVNPNRVKASCLINADRALVVWKNDSLVIFSINGNSVVLHELDALKLTKDIQEWMKPS